MKITQGARILAASEKVDQDIDQDMEIYIYGIRNVTKTNGQNFFYSPKSDLTRRAPVPTNISSNSDPEVWKNGTPASPVEREK